MNSGAYSVRRCSQGNADDMPSLLMMRRNQLRSSLLSLLSVPVIFRALSKKLRQEDTSLTLWNERGCNLSLDLLI